MKRTKNIIGIMVLSVILILISLFFFNETSKYKNRLTPYQENYVSDYEYVPISYAETLKLINNKSDAIIFMGYSTCKYCNALKPIFSQMVQENKDRLPEVFYLDVFAEPPEGEEEGFYMEEEFFMNFCREKLNIEDLSVPLILFIKEGDIVEYQEGTGNSTFDDEIKDIKQEDKEELYNLLCYKAFNAKLIKE